ncbi:MAG: heme-copper oxidase subunit III [Sphingomonadaceae bacterium]
MSIIGTLSEKPWLTPGLPDAAREIEEPRAWDKGVGVGVFLAVVTILFTLLTSAYLMRAWFHEALGHGRSDWFPVGEPPLIWFNTGLLLASSLVFHAGWRSALAGDAARLRLALAAGGLLGFAFLVGQYALWREYLATGYQLSWVPAICSSGSNPFTDPAPPVIQSGNPALAFLFLIAGFHALHIIGGLVAWGVVARRAFAGAAPRTVARGAQLCARYWHFMLLVWLAMMVLFVAT